MQTIYWIQGHIILMQYCKLNIKDNMHTVHTLKWSTILLLAKTIKGLMVNTTKMQCLDEIMTR